MQNVMVINYMYLAVNQRIKFLVFVVLLALENILAGLFLEIQWIPHNRPWVDQLS